jgi:ABC-type Zn uptake system ZnuABC Zn-binding protein ZnuA
MDPNNLKTMASRLTQKLIDIDAPNAAYYTSQNASYQAKLDGLLSRIQGNRTTYEGMKVVVNHPAYTGFFDLLGITQIAAIDVHGEHEEEPGAAHIQEIKEEMVSKNVTIIITSPMGNNLEVNELARASKSKIIYIAALLYMKDENGNDLTDYIQMMDYNLRALGLPKDPPAEIDGFSMILPITALGIVALSLMIKKKNL